MTWSGSANAASACRAAKVFVAIESLTNATPPTSPTGSSRCGTPGNVASASAIRSSSLPSTRAAATAAAAFARLCAPRMTGSAGSGSSPPNSTRRARPGTAVNPRGTTAASSPVCRSNTRSFAALYASTVPWRSRWSDSRFVSTAIRGRNSCTSSSWKLDTSLTISSPGGTASTSPVSGRPTFPATGAPSIAPSSSLVVVLPFVPVTATSGLSSSRKPSSSSLQTGTPRALASRTSAFSAGTPGLLTSRPTPSRSETSPSFPSVRSAPMTSTPRRSSAAAAARPERASPSTSARPGSSAPSGEEVEEVAVVEREAGGTEDPRHDPEADHDLRLGPRLHCEVVVDRRYQEDAAPEVLEREHLDHHGERLDHEDPADQQEQRLRLHHDREAGERPSDRHRAGVSHEHLGGEGVVPEEPDQGPDQRPAEDGQVEVGDARLADQLLAGADVAEDRHDGEGEDRDQARPGGQAVDAVREVDAVRGAGDEEEEERVPGPRERRAHVEAGQVDLRVQVAVPRERADHRRDEGEERQLPAAREAERAAVAGLDEIVDEADQAAGGGGEEEGQRRRRGAGEGEEGERGRDQDQHASHHGRASLGPVALRPLLADLLADLAPAQELDELRADHDRDHHRDDGGDEDSGHYAGTPSRAAARCSRPAAREALTSTTSPGRSTAASSSRASAASAARASPPYSSASAPPTATSTSTPAARAASPISRWKPGAPGTSSAISQTTATVRRPPARSTRWASAARIETGLALYASLISSTPSGSSVSSQRQREKAIAAAPSPARSSGRPSAR